MLQRSVNPMETASSQTRSIRCPCRMLRAMLELAFLFLNYMLGKGWVFGGPTAETRR